MAADFTISQPGGAGSAPLNTDLEDARVGVEIQFASLSPTGNLWALADKPDASSSSLGGTTSQVATLTVDGPGEYAVSLTQGGAVRVLVVEVNRDAAGVVLDYGLVAPARTHFTAGSVTGRGVARTMERFRNAVLVGLAAAVAAGGGGANLDPAGALSIGTVNATSVAIGRVAAPLTALGSTVVVRAQGGTYEYSGDAGTSGLFADGTDITIAQPNGAIKLHPDSSVEVGAADPLQLSSGLVSYAASGGTLRVNARTTDVAPGSLDIYAGGAWNAAVTNLVGGNLRLRGGEPKTRGTQKYGDVQVSLGRHIADGSTAKFAIVYGDATDNPFENELLTVARSGAGASVVSPVSLFFSTTSGSLQATAGPGGDYLSMSGTGSVALVCSNDAGPTFEMVTSASYAGFYNLDSFQVSLMGSGNFYVTHAAPSTDVAAQQIAFKAADATTFATAVAGNKTGGSFSFRVGSGRTPATDPAGAFYFGLGEEVAGVTDIEGGLVFGTGATSGGSIGSATHRPYTTEKGRLNVRYDRLCFNLGMLAAFSAAEPLYIYSNDLNNYIGVGNTGVTFVAFATTRMNFGGSANTIGTTATDLLLNGFSLQASIASADIIFYSGTRKFIVSDYGAASQLIFRPVTDASSTDATPFALFTYSPSTTRPSAYEVFVFVEDASGLMKAWHDVFPARGQGGTAAFAGGGATISGTVLGTADGAVSAASILFDLSGAGVYCRATGIGGTSLNWSGFVREIH